MALLLIAGTFTLVQAQTFSDRSPATSSVKNDNTAFFLSTGFHFESGVFEWRQRFQYGTYLTDHLSWLIGLSYDMNRIKYDYMTLNGPITQKVKTRTLSVPLTLRYALGSDVHFAQIHAGVSYNYITSIRVDGVKQDLTGMKRGYFSGHVRLTALMLLFLEYEYAFSGGPGIFSFGICLDF